MPAQTCVPLARTLTIHGHRRAMASGSLSVGSCSCEEPQAEEEGESLRQDGTLQPHPEAPSLPSPQPHLLPLQLWPALMQRFSFPTGISLFAHED